MSSQSIIRTTARTSLITPIMPLYTQTELWKGKIDNLGSLVQNFDQENPSAKIIDNSPGSTFMDAFLMDGGVMKLDKNHIIASFYTFNMNVLYDEWSNGDFKYDSIKLENFTVIATIKQDSHKKVDETYFVSPRQTKKYVVSINKVFTRDNATEFEFNHTFKIGFGSNELDQEFDIFYMDKFSTEIGLTFIVYASFYIFSQYLNYRDNLVHEIVGLHADFWPDFHVQPIPRTTSVTNPRTELSSENVKTTHWFTVVITFVFLFILTKKRQLSK